MISPPVLDVFPTCETGEASDTDCGWLCLGRFGPSQLGQVPIKTVPRVKGGGKDFDRGDELVDSRDVGEDERDDVVESGRQLSRGSRGGHCRRAYCT